MTPKQIQVMSDYNRWMNIKLYVICAELTDKERKTDKAAFFDSIHGTLNHLLLGDKLWLARFKGKVFEVDGLDQILFEDFINLAKERRLVDKEISDWANMLSEDELKSTFHFTTIVNPASKSCDLALAVLHFFNHQTHHRGQLTTLLNQFGKDVGDTDLLAMPGLVEKV